MYYSNNIFIKKVISDKERLISGELDMYDETEKKIIDFKNFFIILKFTILIHIFLIQVIY
jgi:hypothetical protein